MFLDKLKSYIFVFIQFVGLVLIAVTGPLIAQNKLYLMMEAIGLVLGVWAVWVMKIGNFRVTPDIPSNSRLVTSGPYEYIRHPMYASLLLITLALILDHLSPFRLFLWLILLADLLMKLNYEEELLSGRFKGYSSYKQRTKRLIPFIL